MDQFPVLLIGRGGSRGVPGKNTMSMLGRPMMTYAILAARNALSAGQIYLSTDDSEIARIGVQYGCVLVERPADLASDDALVEDVVVHGFERLREQEGDVDIFSLMLCNGPTISSGALDEGVSALLSDLDLDSAATVSLYNEYSPVRAKRIGDDGLLHTFVDPELIEGASCDRDTQDDCWFCDGGAWVLRSRCADLANGDNPFRWMGKNVYPIRQTAGLDIDHPYGIPRVEHWLRANGFSESCTPYSQHELINQKEH